MSELAEAVDLETLMREHDRIGLLAASLVRLCVHDDPQPRDAALLLARLDRMVRDHVAKEDRAIYPHLLHTHDVAIAEIAQEAVDEFRDLLEQWTAYAATWTGVLIAADWPGFVAATATITVRLGQRVRQEDELLYPMALRQGHIRLRAAARSDQADPPARVPLQPTGQLQLQQHQRHH